MLGRPAGDRDCRVPEHRFDRLVSARVLATFGRAPGLQNARLYTATVGSEYEPGTPVWPSFSKRRLLVGLALAPLAAAGWLSIALLGLVVRLVLFRELRSQGATSVIWGFTFGLFLWLGLLALKVGEGSAIAFALIAGAAIALFVYLRGAALENPPAARPGAYQRRLISHWLARPLPNSALEIEAAEQKRWLILFGLPAVVAAVTMAIAFGTGHDWYLSIAFAAILVDIGLLVWLALSSDTNGVI